MKQAYSGLGAGYLTVILGIIFHNDWILLLGGILLLITSVIWIKIEKKAILSDRLVEANQQITEGQQK